MQEWILRLPWDEIQKAARKHSFDPLLLGAMVQTETGGNPYATRYEPGYRWTSNIHTWAHELRITHHTEELGQQTAWGLLQIMGSTARDMGFRGYFPELCDKEVGLTFACKYLAVMRGRYGEDDRMVAAYNAGSARYTPGGNFTNQKYVDKVNDFLKQLRGDSI